MSGEDIRERVKAFYETREYVPPGGWKMMPLKKRWWIFDVVAYCGECGRRELRLAWPWKTTYRREAVSFVDQYLTDKIETVIAGKSIEFRRQGLL